MWFYQWNNFFNFTDILALVLKLEMWFKTFNGTKQIQWDQC